METSFRRCVALAGEPDRGNIGCIGFKNDRLDRQAGGELADTRGPRIGHGTAEAQLEAETNELIGLLATAVEGVRDAALDADTAQAFQNLINRTPYVQQHRQIQITSELQLGQVNTFLKRCIESRHEEIKPDLADGNRWKFPGDRFEQPMPETGRIVFFVDLIEVQRVDSIRGETPRITLAARPYRRPVFRRHGRNDNLRHPGHSRHIDHHVAIISKLARIQMTVRVDQHG